MAHPVNPKTGGRVVLDLIDKGDAAVVYAAELYLPDATMRGRATIRVADGVVAWAWDGGVEPPAWLVAFATAFLRTEWKARRFAARINRWREEK